MPTANRRARGTAAIVFSLIVFLAYCFMHASTCGSVKVITCTNSTVLTCLSLIKLNGTMPLPVGQLFALAGRRGDANARIARRKRSAV